MKVLAERIADHLRRFEADPAINAPGAGRLQPYYMPGAFARGAYVGVVYISFQGATNLTRAQATAYLEWLDAGNVGRHHKVLGFL